MRSTLVRVFGLVLLASPGLVVLSLALSADFGPLESPGGRFGPAHWVLLAISLLALGYAVAVHAKAVGDQKKVGRPYAATVLFLTAPTAIVLLLTLVVAEVGAGLLPPSGSPGLVFPPHSSAAFKTSEFEWTVKTNSLGIRDREIDPAHRAATRILAIGDSFTNGWGVGAQQAWPKVLERRLRQAGRDVEVFNLAGAGASPKDYALIARRGVDELAPDLVLVGMLQGDDLAQLHFHGGKLDRSRVQGVFERWLPNLSRHLGHLAAARPLDIPADRMRATWQHQARAVLSEELDPHQRRWWEGLDAQIRQMYLQGDLNPALLRFTISHPDLLAFTFDLDDAEVRRAIDTMAAQLVAARESCAAGGAGVLVFSVPAGPYVSRAAQQNLRRLGFVLDETMLASDAPDEAIRRACLKAGVQFHSVTHRFREACRRQTLYYEFDSHFNPAGQALFAEAVADVLAAGGFAPGR